MNIISKKFINKLNFIIKLIFFFYFSKIFYEQFLILYRNVEKGNYDEAKELFFSEYDIEIPNTGHLLIFKIKYKKRRKSIIV